MVDIDRFKAINDDWGHAVGDRVLKEVAARMAASCRSGDLLGRIGGEEFLAVFAAVSARRRRRSPSGCASRRAAAGGDPGGAAVPVTISGGLLTLASGASARSGRGDEPRRRRPLPREGGRAEPDRRD